MLIIQETRRSIAKNLFWIQGTKSAIYKKLSFEILTQTWVCNEKIFFFFLNVRRSIDNTQRIISDYLFRDEARLDRTSNTREIKINIMGFLRKLKTSQKPAVHAMIYLQVRVQFIHINLHRVCAEVANSAGYSTWQPF